MLTKHLEMDEHVLEDLMIKENEHDGKMYVKIFGCTQDNKEV